jgi:7-cyano-7-deazaguanine synthase
MEKNFKNVLILSSGGIDSTACIKYYLDLDFKISSLFIDYGQKSRISERESVERIAQFYKVESSSLSFINTESIPEGEIRGRNGFLIMAALIAKQHFQGLISLGIHKGSPYYDCSKEFALKMNDFVSKYSKGQVTIDTPFIDWDKRMIIEYCNDQKVPLHLTYSCENGDIPCGKCLSCIDRIASHVG